MAWTRTSRAPLLRALRGTMNIIANSKRVEDYFGYWPQFCDGKILSLQFEKKGNINLRISYIDTDQNKRAITDLCFENVSEVELHELRSENVLDELSTEKNGSMITITLEACYGLHGSFSCEKAEVVHVAT